MSHLERPTTTRYLDADGKRVSKDTPGARKLRIRSKKWYGVFVDAIGVRRRVPLTTNKDAARAMLAERVRKVELEKAGVIDRYHDHRKTSIGKHVDDFEAALRAKRTSEGQVKQATARIRRLLIEECGFVFLGDVSPSRVFVALSEMKAKRGDATLSVQTRNHFLTAVKSFGNWLVKDRRAQENPFAHLEGGNVKLDRRHDRQTLSPDQLAKLLGAALASTRDFRGMTGVDRRMLYTVAIYTGLRRDELGSLTPGDVDLKASPPTVTIPATQTKNRQGACQPLPGIVAKALGDYMAGKPSECPLWPGTWAERAAKMLQLDLAEAGLPYVVDGPDGPLHADFHSLRHSFVGLFKDAGISMKTAMRLARHSDPKLTMARYGKAQLSDLGTAVDRLPTITPTAPKSTSTEAETLRATGTDGTLVAPGLRNQAMAGDGRRWHVME